MDVSIMLQLIKYLEYVTCMLSSVKFISDAMVLYEWSETSRILQGWLTTSRLLF